MLHTYRTSLLKRDIRTKENQHIIIIINKKKKETQRYIPHIELLGVDQTLEGEPTDHTPQLNCGLQLKHPYPLFPAHSHFLLE